MSAPKLLEKLQTTLSILNGKTAEIQVGAAVEYEIFEKKYLLKYRQENIIALTVRKRSGRKRHR